MSRRLHILQLTEGSVDLDDVQRHHAQRVLRLSDGDEVELFDDAGRTATGRISLDDAGQLCISAGEIREPASRFELVVAAAVPKGDRADWMVEKLSEVGCSAFVPLLTDRSVVEPKGTGKSDRWKRLATESAKQSRRSGVMRIESPKPLLAALDDAKAGPAWFFDTTGPVTSIRDLLASPGSSSLTLFIGPEGGWSPVEVERMRSAGLIATGLTDTILRVETAAVTAAAIVRTFWIGSVA